MLAAGLAATPGPIVVQAKGVTGNPTVKVEGPLAGIVTSPLTLTPAFDPSITDYVLRCAAGTNAIQFIMSAAPGDRINLTGNNGPTIVLQQNLVENQALIIDSHGPNNPGGTQYWIRCLPHDFPQLAVNRPSTPPPGWYLTGNLNTTGTIGAYAMILDSYGTPVWYKKSSGLSAFNPTLISGSRIAWGTTVGVGFAIDPSDVFERFSLVTHITDSFGAPIPPLDFHELLELPNGDLVVASTPLRSGIDVSVFGGDPSASIVDCVVQELAPDGSLVWTWRMSDHVSAADATHPSRFMVNGQLAYDVFHCNSIDVDSTDTKVLISSRSDDAVYLVDKSTGKLIWKLGGNSTTDGAPHIVVAGDPEGSFHAQHDARFMAGSDISLYDDQSWNPNLAARGVEYHIDANLDVASVVWSHQSPDGKNSTATGSFRRLDGGLDNIIGWGAKCCTLFSEVDGSGDLLMSITTAPGQSAYRVVKYSPETLNLNALRAAVGV